MSLSERKSGAFEITTLTLVMTECLGQMTVKDSLSRERNVMECGDLKDIAIPKVPNAPVSLVKGGCHVSDRGIQHAKRFCAYIPPALQRHLPFAREAKIMSLSLLARIEPLSSHRFSSYCPKYTAFKSCISILSLSCAATREEAVTSCRFWLNISAAAVLAACTYKLPLI